MNAPFTPPAIDPSPLIYNEASRSWISKISNDWIAVRCTKALTDMVERLGHGLWLSDQPTSFLRAELYNKAGINDWSPANDVEACRRLKLWGRLFWLPRQEGREVE